MRLHSCHIEQFGKWSDRTFTFESGCNVLCEENGWGKSMLAAFLRTMFYGFSGGKSRDDLVNERKRYQPWQGGVCGGSVTFEAGGKVYELTRVFGAKEKDDKFELRDASTNLKCDDYTENIGEELFGIDRAAFCRTVFITQNDCQTEVTDGVNAKLGNLTGEKDDLMNFEAVNQRLTDLINSLSPTRKTGELAKMKAELGVLKDQVSFGPATDKDISADQEIRDAFLTEQEELKIKRSGLLGRQQELFVCRERLIRQKQYEELCKTVSEREEDKARSRNRFPGELPEETELARYLGECADLLAEKKTAFMFQMTEEDIRQLSLDRELFVPGRPSDEVLAQKNEQADLYRQLHWEQSNGRPTAKEEQMLSWYVDIFGEMVPDREELKNVEEAWRTRASQMSILMTKNDYLHRMEAQEKAKAQEELQRLKVEKKRGFMIGFICEAVALVCVIVGIVLMAGAKVLNGIALGLFIAAVAAAVFGLFKLRSANSVKIEEASPAEDEEIALLRREIEAADLAINEVEIVTKEYLSRWNRECRDEMVLSELANLSAQMEEYEKLREKSDRYLESRVDERINELKAELESFVRIYYPGAEITEQNSDDWIETLRRDRNRYNDLRERKRRQTSAEEKYRRHYDRITNYIGSLGFKAEEDLARQLQQIQADLLEYRRCEEDLRKAIERRAEFVAANDMEQILIPVDTEFIASEQTLAQQLDETERRMEELRRQIHEKEALLDELREKRDAISASEELLEVRKEEYKAGEDYFKTLKKTKEYLEKAKTSFTAKYTEPIMSGFEKYYRLLTGKAADGCYLDANLKLTVREQGLQRETKVFSEGWKDLLGICMRMALVDAMYREEKPMVIFDDPFVNLDREKTAAALKFLEEIGKEYQVIYFTCHESRVGAIKDF